MINTQEYIITELKKTLEKMIILSSRRLDNLVAIVLGIIVSKSTILSNISEELNDFYSTAKEESKIKRIQRFLTNKKINPEHTYEYFAYKLLKNYKNHSKRIYIIFDHTTIKDKFVILQFSLKIGKRAVPLWYKVFKYKEKGNKNFKHVKEGLNFIYSITKEYDYEVIVLADRGFKSIDLFKYIDEVLKFKYCIRCTKDLGIEIDGKSKIKKLQDINTLKNKTKHLTGIKLTAQKYLCNIAICKAEDKEDTWYIANNLEKPLSIREYKKRFDIEEMFKDFKSGGFNLEDTWSKNIHYVKMLYFCVYIAYCWMITLGTSCTKDRKNRIISTTKRLKGKQVRIYSIFRSGLKWFKRCYYQCKKKYHLKTVFTLYEGQHQILLLTKYTVILLVISIYIFLHILIYLNI
ncbi:IS4 family transposase [Dethiothermospora halolimnae]|uniref:IS4 family transposase n=1 Tax=Dethiothermospora halolimnae TaxID=3114390 RepID=UPI003CCB9C39